VPRIDISNLVLGSELGGGGQGKVTEVNGLMINGQWPAALKIYTPGASNPDTAVLERIVGFPRQLSPGDSSWLHEHTAWPAMIAEDSGTVRGFLMRTVPDAYYFGFHTRTRGTRRHLADVAFLLNTDQYVRSSGLAVSDRDRLSLLTSLAQALTRLHSLDVVVGDLSPKNLLFSLAPSPGCFIIDCDAMRVRGETVLAQIQTPDWEVPGGELSATPASDAYKFGLLAIRLFARDQSSSDPAAIGMISPEMGRLAAAVLHDDPSGRPAPQDWIPALTAALATVPAAAATPATPSPSISVPIPMVTSAAFPHAQAPPRRPTPAPAPARPAPRRGSVTRLLAFAGLGLLALIAVIIGLNASSNSGTGSFSSDSSPGAAVSSAPNSQAAQSGSQPTPSAQPTSVGGVGIGDSILGDPAATAVAGMFNTYFTGINSRDYQQALSVFDPGGVINPNDSNQVRQFTDGVSTTSDSAITLADITPSDGSPVQSAELHLTSQQQAGYGPKDDPNATCTNWDITYTLSQDSSGNYLINNVSNSTDSAC
jgi:hypothetical protein